MPTARECVDQTDRLRTRDRGDSLPDATPEQRYVMMGSGDQPWRERLSRVIEGEIIPRLMLAHQTVPMADAPGRFEARRADVDGFARLVIAGDVADAVDYVQELRRGGMSAETLFLDVLAPVARRLGEMWSQDLCDFVDVTLGVSRLQNLMRELNPAFRLMSGDGGAARRILLLPAPGETHTFGLAMVEKFFRNSGWDVAGGAGSTCDALIESVQAESFGVVGLSLSCETRIDELAAVIRMVRKSSRNPDIGVMVGGQIFQQRPELVVLIGADATAPDGFTAVLLAQCLLDLRVRA